MSSSFAKQPSLRTKIIRADAFRSGANLDEMELVPTPCFSAVGGNQHPSQTTSGNFHITACKKITIARHWNYEKCSRRCRRHLAVSIPTIEPRNGLSTPQQLCEEPKLITPRSCAVCERQTNKCVKLWRRGRDSNPRYGCPYTAFRVRRIRPLCHLSACIGCAFGHKAPVEARAPISRAPHPCQALFTRIRGIVRHSPL